ALHLNRGERTAPFHTEPDVPDAVVGAQAHRSVGGEGQPDGGVQVAVRHDSHEGGNAGGEIERNAGRVRVDDHAVEHQIKHNRVRVCAAIELGQVAHPVAVVIAVGGLVDVPKVHDFPNISNAVLIEVVRERGWPGQGQAGG